MSVVNKLDQYYTKPVVAKKCFEKLLKTLPETTLMNFIEPSAGCGSFLNLLPKDRRVGLDIDPRQTEIIKKNFLKWNKKHGHTSNNVVIGNPPFGKRSKLAIQFFNHGAKFADTIAFVVPVQFRKYSVQSKLNKDFKLILEHELAENSFQTPKGKDFAVRCVFQIWTRTETAHKNLRLLTSPPTKHEDFLMYQYNNTPGALKFFNYDWDFAVPRQGYENYSRRETSAKKCESNKQWILFKPKNKIVHKKLWNIDFAKLARKNTAIFGFGKADVILEYNKLYK